jgi:hypothetical protein
MRTAFALTAVVGIVALASCAPATRLTSSWTDPTQTGHHYQKVAVVGVTPRTTIRRQYESVFAADLQKRGIAAVTSFSVLGEGQVDSTAAGAFMQNGVDGVIVTRLVDQETYNTYYPPTYSTAYVPSSYYGGWYGYYNMGYTYETSPGYTVENKVFRLESNLYNLTSGKLAWSGLTETTLMSGDAPEREIQPVVDELIANMVKSKVLTPKGKH